jgi:M6 family metalloprotease-like protein
MACLCCWVGALAVPANPNPYVVTQPDGTRISVRLCGDEYYHYYTTEDGTPVTLCDDGFYRYTTIDSQNNLVASANVVGKVNASVLPDKKSVIQRHKELHKVNKMRKSVKLPEAQAPMRSAARNAGSNGGVVKGVIVLAEFQDQKFTFSQKAINDKMNKVGYTDEYGSIGSARDYFVAQSYGQFQPEFDVVGPVTLSQNMAYYGANYQGANDIRPHEMVAEACQLASQQGLADMSDYDHDGDGWVDLVYVIYAGYPESSGAPSETIWPHAWYVYSGGGLLVTLDGVKLNAYACSAELNGNSGSNLEGIGTFCHEYSHTLGLPDFYDIDYSGAMGMSWWSIMDHGSYGANGYIPIGYNAYEREFCGWLEFNELTGDASITMPELTTDKTAAYKITSTNPNQYIIIETRCRKGWDVALFSEGMMVIAVDYNKKAWDSNGPNDDPNRQRFKLIPADNNWSESDLYGDLYPYGGNTTLSSSSSPKMKVHNTTINGKSITGIAYNNGVTTFDFKMDDVSGDEQDSDLSYLEGTYNAFANSFFQGYPDERWTVNITVDEIEKGKVWIQPICKFGGLSAKYINPVYATYNAEDNTLIMPSGQVVYEDSESKFVIAQTTTGSDINLTHNFVMQIEKNDYDVEISFANDCYIGVGNILNDEWWYQALQNVSYSKTTAGGDEEGDEVPAELEGVYDAFANSAFQGNPDEKWQVNITIDKSKKGKVWIQPICMFGGLDALDITPIYATYNAADNTLIMPLGQVVYEGFGGQFVIAQTIDGSDIDLTDNVVMQIDNNESGVNITFANDYIIGVGDILNNGWWYQALQNVSYSKTTVGGDEVPAELEGVYNAFANSGYNGGPDEEWQVNITIDKSEKGKVWIQPVCMLGGLDAVDISPIYATYNAADNTLNMPLGQVVYEDSQYKMVLAQTTNGSDKNLTGNVVMQIDNNESGVNITFANDYIIGVGDILNDGWWYQALQNVSYSKTTVGEELATSISLDKTEVSLEATETTTLTATVLPETTVNKSVIWTSSNEAVATVDANGVVTAIALGEAVITATTTDGSDLSATCKVTVVPTLVVSIEVTPNSVEAEENSEVQLSVNVLPENATYKSVEWSSSNDAIASVNANGLVKIYKEGNVVITATTTDGTNLSATCHINVYSGIDGVNGNDVIVATIGDNIVVKNAKLGSNVIVYAVDGRIISSKVATDGDVVVEAPAKGIYVVAIDGKSFKVMVK